MTQPNSLSRRNFFNRMSDGLCGAALLHLLNQDDFGGRSLMAAEEPARRSYNLKPLKPHFQPKAKRVIQLFMQGGPSQVDLLDPKPLLDKHQPEFWLLWWL